MVDKRLLLVNDLFFRFLVFLIFGRLSGSRGIISAAGRSCRSLLANLELRDLTVDAIFANVHPIASVLPVSVRGTPCCCSLLCELIGLFLHTFVRVEVDRGAYKLGLAGWLSSRNLGRDRRLQGSILRGHKSLVSLDAGSGRISGDLPSVVFGAYSSHRVQVQSGDL